jgi:acetate kinase
MTKPFPSILVLNGGSSSIRFALLRADRDLTRLCSGTMERIGHDDAHLAIDDAAPAEQRQAIQARDQHQAVHALVQWLRQRGDADGLAAVGHRVVHGMAHFDPERITPELLADLRRVEPVDPDHLPMEIGLVEAARAALPQLPQVACFDTQFHRYLPRVAALLPIPRRFEAQGLRRYGFHGLSYAFLLHELERIAGARAARGRLILAHLGGGASLAAVRDGRCIDTTMSFTPTAGLVMGTRSGDLDPSLAPYLERIAGVDSAQFLKMVNHESGLLGVSGRSADMRELQAAEADDPHAAEAIALFCYQARKAIGSFAAALGGLDTLVFAGGIGENAPTIRARICEGLHFLGVELDSPRNARAPGLISSSTGRVAVHVIRTNEAHVIARAVRDLLALESRP